MLSNEFSLSEYTKVDVGMMEWEGRTRGGDRWETEGRKGGEKRKERDRKGDGQRRKNERGIAPWLLGIDVSGAGRGRRKGTPKIG